MPRTKPNTTQGRPAKWSDETVFALRGDTADTRLQEATDRRAVIDFLIEAGGRATKAEIDAHFGYDTLSVLTGCVRTGWLSHHSKGDLDLPRRRTGGRTRPQL